MLRLFGVLSADHHLCKIRAHQPIPKELSSDEAYLRLGNQVADKHANDAATMLLPEFAADLQGLAQGVHHDKQLYQAFLHYVVDLQTARAKADQGEDFTTSMAQQCSQTFDPFSYFVDWAPVSSWTFPDELDMRWICNCAWGSEVAEAAIQYLRGCQWPDVTHSRSTNPIGISWVEIAVGIMHYLGEYIPVRRYDATGRMHLIRVRNYDDVLLHHATLREMAENVSLLLSQLPKLTTTKLMPFAPRSRVRSLYMLGASHFSQGYQLRPRTEFQEETTITCVLYLQKGKVLPDMGFQQPSSSFSPTLWDTRKSLAAKSMKEVRAACQVSPSSP